MLTEGYWGDTPEDIVWDERPLGREIWKDPITDDGTKKSAKGLLMVDFDEEGSLYMKDQCTSEEEKQGLLQVVFEDGELKNETDLESIRKRIKMYNNDTIQL